MTTGKEKLQQWMGQLMELELADGRLITGHLMCTDNNPNIVMSQCVERWPDDPHNRFVGLVMVARQNMKSLKRIVRTPVPAPPEEKQVKTTVV
ncbi:hypothetical protein PMAYCL1PPCAC_24479 [Pristionchus mayeri]|uniref:Sm domain-containing protein n=1 Tax=Pristionchus mayeri TaxID=1317129 RepID=A0AAN5I7F2_9BILA|nr:hypothetical protein PMAYCL1PPCAC_24479 [Pristionchus mayeri]